ncbi:tetratricopeptide repeat protein [Halosquirtibacter xylanolyticus]|uniref:tetratricopeptide repeat protein n=1 Tax=Halosquirtibacter xylanolyticus TaxID=3374599 RepID=UPI00374877C5|nr:tetratricopeptide repeat protein [Prolixibacteraceae bacterium]
MKSKLLCLLCIPLFVMCKAVQVVQTTPTDPNVKIIDEKPEEVIVNKRCQNIRLALTYAKERMQNYDYKNALDTLQGMYTKGVYDYSLLKQLEAVNFVLGDYPSCISLLDKMEEEKPHTDQLTIHKGIVYRKIGEFSQARDLFSGVLERDSSNVFLLEQVGDMSKEIGLVDQYPAYYLLALKSGASSSVLNKYLSYLMSKDLNQEALDAVYEYAPPLMRPYKKLRYSYGVILYRLKRYLDAHDVFTQLIEDKSRRLLCYYYAGLSLCQEKRYKDAIPLLEFYVKNSKDIDSYAPYHVLGCCYMDIKENDKAMNMFKLAVKMIYPEEKAVMSVYSKMADVYSEQKKYKDAALAFQSIEKFYPNEEYALFQMALLHHSKTKNFKKAASYYRKVLKNVSPSDTADNELKKYFYMTSKSELKKLEKHLFWTK